jgi:two-component system cell cycle response regulator DivK
MAIRLLLVEDNEMNRDMLSRRLARKGFEVLIATDGQEGIDQTLKEKPDLILMDMSLPVVDGWEATRRLKANPDCCNIPVIGLTAHAMDGDREKCLEAGCNEYETKPVDLPSLLDKIFLQLQAVGIAWEQT